MNMNPGYFRLKIVQNSTTEELRSCSMPPLPFPWRQLAILVKPWSNYLKTKQMMEQRSVK